MNPAKSSSFLLLSFCMLVIGFATNCSNGPAIEPVDESHKHEQPIEFPHDIHAGENGIACNVCHNATDEGKTPGIPTEKVCLKCHKQINGTEN